MRVSFLVDGFNLYHSLRTAQKDLNGQSTKWLDLKSLCRSYLYQFGREARLENIYYFSALAKHRRSSDSSVTQRHELLINCWIAEDVIVNLSRFKPKTIQCPSCKVSNKRYEEKETDVKLALQLIEVFIQNTCDFAVLVTGDTDLAPAFTTAGRLFPDKDVCFAFPYKRENKELKKLAPQYSFSISKEQYVKHQFPDCYTLPNGQVVTKPNQW